MKRKITVPFHKPSIGQAEIDAVVDVLRSGWLTTGKLANEFEYKCADYLHSKQTLALSSGTAALSISYRLAGFEGEKVIVPSYTFGSCVAELLHMNAKPILVDIEEETFNLDIDYALNLAVENDAKGIVAVHFAGQPCDMNLLEEETAKRNMSLVDDACHAFGASSKGRKIGSFNSLSAFSFYATKCITTAEGGLISTARTDLLKKARVLSLHGISKDAWMRYSEEGNWFYEIVEKGYKANISDVLAALGLAQLEKADMFLRRRKRICLEYDNAFRNYPELRIPFHKEDESSYHIYPLRIRSKKLTKSRNKIVAELKELGVQCSVHFIPIHMHPYFRDCPDISWSDLRITEQVYSNEISLPLFPDMKDDQIKYVIDTVCSVIENSCI